MQEGELGGDPRSNKSPSLNGKISPSVRLGGPSGIGIKSRVVARLVLCPTGRLRTYPVFDRHGNICQLNLLRIPSRLRVEERGSGCGALATPRLGADPARRTVSWRRRMELHLLDARSSGTMRPSLDAVGDDMFSALAQAPVRASRSWTSALTHKVAGPTWSLAVNARSKRRLGTTCLGCS
jgi:hypothetical protein